MMLLVAMLSPISERFRTFGDFLRGGNNPDLSLFVLISMPGLILALHRRSSIRDLLARFRSVFAERLVLPFSRFVSVPVQAAEFTCLKAGQTTGVYSVRYATK